MHAGKVMRMIWMVGLVLAAIVFAVLLSLVAAIVMVVIDIAVRLALGAGLAVAAGVFAGVAADGLGWDGTMSGVVVAVLGFVPALLLVGRWRSSAALRHAKGGHPSEPLITVAPLDPYGQAWATARRLAPKAELKSTQVASARVLALAERDGAIDPEILDCATMLRRHVPALVSETEELLATANRAERDVAVDELIADLRKLGEQAADLLARQGFSAREKLAVRRARLFGTGPAV